jgi:uncharacterized membrane protein
MSDVPMQIIVAAFKDPGGAGKVLKMLENQHWLGIQDAAVVTKDADGKLRITDTKDMGGGKGMVVGALVGGAIGVLTGGIGWLVLGGGALGGLGAKLRDGGLPDKRLREMGARLPPNASALIAVIEQGWVADAEQQLRAAGGEIVTEQLSADLAAQLKIGGDGEYTVVDNGASVVPAGGAPVTAPSPAPGPAPKTDAPRPAAAATPTSPSGESPPRA